MNLTATILRDVSAAGGMIAVRDGRLKLTATKPLPEALLKRVREAKPILLAALQSPAAWDFLDGQAFFDERAGIAEHDGRMIREKAELMAYESCIACWLNKNPSEQNNLDVCPQCCQLAGTNALAVITGNGRYIWLHDRCHTLWIARRRQEAIIALAAMGISNHRDSL